MFGNFPPHPEQGSLESFQLAWIEIRQCVEHAVVKRWRRPKRLNQVGVDVPRSLLVDPDEIPNRSGVRMSISQRFKHIHLARARVSVFANVRVELEQLYLFQVDSFLAEEV